MLRVKVSKCSSLKVMHWWTELQKTVSLCFKYCVTFAFCASVSGCETVIVLKSENHVLHTEVFVVEIRGNCGDVCKDHSIFLFLVVQVSQTQR